MRFPKPFQHIVAGNHPKTESNPSKMEGFFVAQKSQHISYQESRICGTDLPYMKINDNNKKTMNYG